MSQKGRSHKGIDKSFVGTDRLKRRYYILAGCEIFRAAFLYAQFTSDAPILIDLDLYRFAGMYGVEWADLHAIGIFFTAIAGLYLEHKRVFFRMGKAFELMGVEELHLFQKANILIFQCSH